jgi:hypothetical protein
MTKGRFIKWLERNEREKFKLFYPKQYNGVGGWGHPKEAAAFFTQTCIDHDKYSELNKRRELSADENTNRLGLANGLLIGVQLTKYNQPCYWITEAMFQMADKTDFPENMTLGDLNWPLPAMAFLLPAGLLVSHERESYNWIGVAKFQPKDKFGVTKELVGICSSSAVSTNNITQTYSINSSLASLNPEHMGNAGALEKEKDSIFAKRILRITTNLILFMMAKPELVEKNTTEGKTVHQASMVKRNVFNPIWIGKNYQIRRVSESVGTHSSPVMHYRRGHWRSQACGPGYSIRKNILIDPVLVNCEV